MDEPDKLPLVKRSLGLLVNQLRPEDHVAIVVYAGAAGLVLPSTSGADKGTIRAALDRLEAGGSTAGGEGIVLAYDVAKQNFLPHGNNRVILATDGDFNVGVSDQAGLIQLIESKRSEGIFLTTLGFGTGNLQDGKMEQLADKGNGHYDYVDGDEEARRIFIGQLGATLLTIAKDVKLQVEFNPEIVGSYRLIGYENRMLAAKDFDDDTKDAGELGAGHSVTALYEIAPHAAEPGRPRVAPLLNMRGEHDGFAPASFGPRELMQVKLRYKQPDGEKSSLIVGPAIAENRAIDEAPENIRFAAAVAEWGMLLRNSKYKGNASYGDVLALARNAVGSDDGGFRREFISLVDASRNIGKN
jgi:Ca-activated chloride channel family protein